MNTNGREQSLRDQFNERMRQSKSKTFKPDNDGIVDAATEGSVRPFKRKTNEEILEIRARCERYGSDILKQEYGHLSLQLAVEREVVKAFQIYVRELESENDRLTTELTRTSDTHTSPAESVVDGTVTGAITEMDRV